VVKRRSNLHYRRKWSERGMALITTVLILTLMGALAATALVAASGGATVAAQDQSYAAALGAADAGVDDLLYWLNANENISFELADNIYNYDKQLSSAPSTACPTSDTPPLPPAACGWVTMPDDNDSARTMQYEYDIPSNHPPVPNGAATTAGATGTSMLVFDVLGRVVTSDGQTFTRSIRVVLSRSTFLNYGYFTNVESQDPQQYDLDPNYPGWPEFGPGWGSGITAWNGAATQTSQPENAYDAALDYCQNYWFEANPSPDETSQATAAGVTISTDPRSNHTEQSNGYSLNNICTFTKWESGDTFYGPIRTNDVFFVDGSTNFYGPVVVGTPCNMLSSADPGASKSTCPTGVLGEGTAYTPGATNKDGDGVYWVDTHNILYGSPITPNFSQPPSYAPPVDLPPDNPDLQTAAEADGCLYEGMTYFDFLSNGDVYVYSPGTAAAVAAGTFTLNSGCSANGDVVLSSHPVLYVEQASSTTGCVDSKGSDYTFGGLVQSNDYYTGEIAYADSGGALSQWKYGNGSGYSPATDTRAFACDNGDAWVGGVVSGSATVGAANNIVVYQNLSYANTTYTVNSSSSPPSVTSSGPDVLGLEPTNDVVVYHPVDCPSWDSSPGGIDCGAANNNSANNDFSSSCPSGQATTWTYGSSATPADCQVNVIKAAILAFNGEYTAENYSFGANMGTLTLFGSVAEAYRGRLAGTSTGSGYGKQYIYDPRLATLTPPSFLPPALFSWSEDTWSEVSGQVKAVTANTEAVPTPASTPTPTAPTYTVPPTGLTTTTTVPATTTTTAPTTTSSTTTSTSTTTTTSTTVPTTTTTTAPTTTTTHATTTTTTTTVPTTTTTTAPTTTTTHATAPSFPASEQTVDAENWCYVKGSPNLFYTWNGSAWVSTGSSSFTVTASGVPTPTVTGTSSTSYMTVTSGGSGAGTATVTGTSGTSGFGQNGYTVTFTASNGTSPNATLTYTINMHNSVSGCGGAP
jgi:hypothetical protein